MISKKRGLLVLKVLNKHEMFCGRLLYFMFNVGLLYARMALLSFLSVFAKIILAATAVATMAWRFSREVTYVPVEGGEDF